MKKGLVHIYTGDGKGKSTAAMGLCLRAAGHGLRVGIAQFLKDGRSGELSILSQIENVHIYRFLPDVKFTFAMTGQDREQAVKFYRELLDEIIAGSPRLDVLLLDEIIAAVTTGIVDLSTLTGFLKNRTSGLEVVLTGRNPPQELLDTADYISEIHMIRHPYQKGEAARKGIEW